MAFAKFKVKNGLSVSSGNSSRTSIVPVGLIIPWINSTAPDGWLVCDGTTISATTYPALTSLIGTTLPDIRDSIVIGRGTGTGNGSSGLGNSPTSIINGVALQTRIVNTLAIASSSKSAVSATHDHPIPSHDHPMAHAHSYPHSHSGGSHTHGLTHNHGISSDGGHVHAGRFTNQYTTGAGSSIRTAGGTIPAADDDLGHNHPQGNAGYGAIGADSSAHNNPVATGTFAASATTSTGPTTDLSLSFGGSSAFDVTQPSIRVYYIIKY